MAKYTPVKPDPDAAWLTVPEAMWLSHLSKSWLYMRIKSGEIDSKLAGRYRIIRRESLDAYIESLPTYRGEPVESAA